jgi:hypothetical protein
VIVSIVVKNTTKLSHEDWIDFTVEIADCIGDHAVKIRSVDLGAGKVTWTAEFNDVGEDIAIAKAALKAIASKPGGEYAWLGVTDAGVSHAEA